MGLSGAVKLLVFATLIVVFATASWLSYSTTGYTMVKYPGVDGRYVVCVEGEVNPTNQTITVSGDGGEPTVNPYVTVNGIRHVFNFTVEGDSYRQPTDAFTLGCNEVEYDADTDNMFSVKVDYLSHWRPVVRYLEIGNLIVGHEVRYFISTEDADKREIVTSRLNITDITHDMYAKPIMSREFKGPATRYMMEQPGNYKADLQVHDGYVWSDIWEVGFTAHVITTDEQKKAYRTYTLEDDPIRENEGLIPAAVRPDDNDALKASKKFIDGAYMFLGRVGDYLTYQALEAKESLK